MTQQLQQIIDAAWDDRANISPTASSAEVRDAVEHVITELNNGKLRVATREAVGQWTVHQWIKKAVLLSFRLKDNEQMQAGSLGFYDKVPTKFSHLSAGELKESGVRIVPPAVARRGSFIAKGAILMPSYVNIGAWVGPRTMVDTWATVGSGAQIGADVHLAGGAGIGGVLEPPGARPVVIEDGAFVGSRSVIVEGVVVQEQAVIAPQVVLSATVPIIDVTGSRPREYRGFVPARSVVVPGTRPRAFPAGEFNLACALIIGQRAPSTDLKTSLNEALREYGIGS
jgi:2,3,4,5-tetrahydropyridine-2-carboxylate N-succinyltransferase